MKSNTWVILAMADSITITTTLPFCQQQNQHQSQNDVIISKKGKLGATQPLDYVLTELNVFCGEGNGTPLQYSCLENPMD